MEVMDYSWAISKPNDDAVKVLYLIYQQIWKIPAVATGLEKVSFIPISKKGNARERSNYDTIALISHANKLMLKTLQIRLQQYMNRELPDVQAELRKGRGTKDQIANIFWITEKAREFQNSIYFCFIDYAKAFDCMDQSKLWKFWKRWEYQITWPGSWEICMQVKKQQLEMDMEQQTGFKSGKEYIKVAYCHPAYLTYMQSI